MARREASYLIDSSREEEDKVKSLERQAQYALSRRINKMSSTELFDYTITTSTDVSKSLHISNNRDSWSEIYSNLKLRHPKDNERLETYKNIVSNIVSKSNTFLNSIDNVKSISNIVDYYLFSLNNIDTWEPKRNNPHLQLHSLIDHLFAKYKVPLFLYKGFYTYENRAADHKMIELFLHIGSGASLKKFDRLPTLKMNNKIYHYLFTTPENLNFYKAFRRAQILSMGGDEWLFNILMDSKLNAEATANHDDFWVTVIQFFITNTMVSDVKIKEIIDYIDDQKFQRRYVNGVYEAPPQANFNMKGRTVDSLMRMSDNWHRIQEEAARAARAVARGNVEPGGRRRYYSEPVKDYSWDKSGIRGYFYENKKQKISYDIIELINSRQLRDQSESQRNCVYSYASQCAAGTCHIFTLRDTLNGPILTIEVKGYKIVQIRGKCNRMATEAEMKHVKAWADNNRLTIG